MIEALDQLDRTLFSFINGWHNPFWDQVMYGISSKEVWIPVYLLILFFVYKKVGWKSTLLVVGCLVILITLSDQTASGLLKPWIERLRPCQAGTGLDAHIINGYCGSKFGFASSHAANFFAWATFVSLFFKRNIITFLCLFAAIATAYSRVYLGVHYPGDVLAGAAIGSFYGGLISMLFFRLNKMAILNQSKPPDL